MARLFRKEKAPAPRREKIADPVQDAARRTPGAYVCREKIDRWEPWAVRYTTTAHFGQVEHIRYFNNCGPTALTNLICMVRQRYRAEACSLPAAQTVYHQVARFGVRHLYFLNSARPWAHGTSDLRAGSYIRRMCRRLLGFAPRVRLRRPTEKNIRRSLASGALLYLMLWGHPAYGSHHLLACGCERVENTDTGALRTYLKVCDGHTTHVRYVDLADVRGLYWEVRFPEEVR